MSNVIVNWAIGILEPEKGYAIIVSTLIANNIDVIGHHPLDTLGHASITYHMCEGSGVQDLSRDVILHPRYAITFD